MSGAQQERIIKSKAEEPTAEDVEGVRQHHRRPVSRDRKRNNVRVSLGYIVDTALPYILSTLVHEIIGKMSKKKHVTIVRKNIKI